ncbi:MAG: hypothetical protein IKR19_07715 [Acholeplasmatales bacterium]|nr:hypothetical protein [Acholeplasmatales bacterium]
MTIDEMRFLISQEYNTVTWKEKVKRMPDNQVVAIYYSFQNRKKNSHPNTKPLFSTSKKKSTAKKIDDNKQYNLFDKNYNPDTKGSYSFDDDKPKEIEIKDCHQITILEYLNSLKTEA